MHLQDFSESLHAAGIRLGLIWLSLVTSVYL
jgi:hypothetical protein